MVGVVQRQVLVLFLTPMMESKGLKMQKALIVSVLALVCVGCSESSSDEDYVPLPPVNQQFALEPPYHTSFVGRPPHPVPYLKEGLKPEIEFKSEVSVNAHNEFLETVVKDLAKQVGFRPYVAAMIAKRRVSLTASGSLDDVSKQLANSAKASVSVDHLAHELRFMR